MADPGRHFENLPHPAALANLLLLDLSNNQLKEGKSATVFPPETHLPRGIVKDQVRADLVAVLVTCFHLLLEALMLIFHLLRFQLFSKFTI
jgi:hypothetical protein